MKTHVDRGMWLLLFLILACWVVGIQQPGFDFDEALYVRMVQEMKLSHQYAIPFWDGKPYYDKPPTYMWSLLVSSWLLDGSSAYVSPIAMRLPSLLFSWATVLLLVGSWTKFVRLYAGLLWQSLPQWLRHPALPGILYTSAALPSIGSKAILLDPLLTLLYTPVFLILTHNTIIAQNEKSPRFIKPLSFKQSLVVGCCMGIATWVKGLIGFVVPGLAIGLLLLVDYFYNQQKSEYPNKIYSILKSYFKNFIPSFLIAIFLSLAFYSVFFAYILNGEKFVSDFFLIHHFGRGTSAMEGHSGSIFYHPGIVLFGGINFSSLLTMLLVIGMYLKFYKQPKLYFPSLWMIAFFIFFGAMATKLPNYTWPVWPAAVVLTGFLLIEFYLTKIKNFEQPISKKLLFIVYLLGGAFPLALGILLIALGLFYQELFAVIPMDIRARIVIKFLGQFPLEVRYTLVTWGTIILLLLIAQIKSIQSQHFGKFVTLMATATAFCNVLVSHWLLSFATKTVTNPIESLVQWAEQNYPFRTIVTLGMYSPTASLNIATFPLHQYGRGEDTPFESPTRLVLTQQWNFKSCNEHGFKVLRQDHHIIICGQP